MMCVDEGRPLLGEPLGFGRALKNSFCLPENSLRLDGPPVSVLTMVIFGYILNVV